MATYKAHHLKEMIREVVREEIKGVVASVIAEVLSERYLRQLVESNVSAQPRGVNRLPIQGDDRVEDDDETPMTLANTIRMPGQPHPMFHKDEEENAVRQHGELDEAADKRNQMLSLFFEGTKPLDRAERDAGMSLTQVEGEPGMEVEEPAEEPEAPKGGRRSMNEVWTELAGVNKAAPETVVDQATLMAREEARLKALRESLERPAK